MSMPLLDKYFELQQQVHEYFDYQEDWRVFPLADLTHRIWAEDGSTVFSADSQEDFDKQDGFYYESLVYHQRHLPKAVYPGKDFTMIVVDTQCDLNILLSVFDNSLLSVFDNSLRRNVPNPI